MAAMLSHDISLYVAHTNIDISAFGLSDYIAQKIGIVEGKPLSPVKRTAYYKLVVYSPAKSTEEIVKVLGDNGAGFIGGYSHCTFRTAGVGTFKPLEQTHPYIGEVGEVATVLVAAMLSHDISLYVAHTNIYICEVGEVATVIEDRIETIIDEKMVKTLIAKIKRIHPYEEMAYDLYPLSDEMVEDQDGLGKIGLLQTPMSADDFLDCVKASLCVESLRTAGKPPKVIKRVALCTGSGAEFIGLAKVKNADVYITGDLKYHDAQRAAENNLWVMDAGHYGTEKMVAQLLQHTIKKAFPDAPIVSYLSEAQKDFFQYH